MLLNFSGSANFVSEGHRVMKRAAILVVLALAATSISRPALTQTLKAVQDRGSLVCGVSEGLYGFSAADEKGNWAGFDVDFCRALAAAIFNDPAKIKFVALSATDRFAALTSGAIDVLSRNTTWTISREAGLKINFATVTYYDGQGFLVPRALKVESALELGGKMVCAQSGTTTELNLADFFNANGMKYELINEKAAEDVRKAYEAGRCNVLTSDISQLFAERLKLPNPGAHVILPDIISKEPLGPVVRHGDDQWFNIVKWTHFAMVNAEELGVTSKAIDQAMKSEQIGLTRDWAARIVRLVGNYEEVFERNVGVGSRLGIPRGINNLWTNGGIQYAPPIR
jgi:general L-amino acid transport system substrate-binding protein